MTENKNVENIFDLEESLAKHSDFDHWSKAAYWTAEEAAALFLSMKPEILNSKSVKDSGGKIEIANKFEHLVTLCQRAWESKLLPSRRPSSWLNWAADANIEIDNRLADSVAENSMATINFDFGDFTAPEQSAPGTNVATPNTARRKSDETRVTETLLKIIIGMAMEQYGFDAKATRNGAASQISDDLALHGISVSEDTIRKYLNDAKELLP